MAAKSTEYQLAIKIAGAVSSSFTSAMGTASSALSNIGHAAATAAKVAGVAIGAATTAMAAFTKSAIDAGMEFDKSMSQVAATMGVSTEDIADLRNLAIEMGSKTAFSATEAAEALNYMALAGYDAQTQTAMLPTVLNLAAAGGMELANASDMITDSQSALGLTLEETAIMVDQMAQAASKSNTSVAQLGDAILTVGGTAQYMAGGTEEINTVLGILADNGIKGSEAGTHLRNMLLKLSSPTKDATKLLNQLGVEVFDDASGNMRSFADIFPELNAAMASMTDQEKLDAMSTLFNSRDIASATALMGTSVERWGELGDAILNSAGAAEQMANTQLDNLAGDITLWKSALEGAQITLSDQLTPSLREFVQFGTEGLGRITDAFKEGGLEGAMEAFGGVLSDGLDMIIGILPTAIDAGMKLLGALGQGILDNLPTITNAAVEIIIMLMEGIAQAAPALVRGGIKAAGQFIIGMAKTLPDLLPLIHEAVVEVIWAIIDEFSSIDLPLGSFTAVGDALRKIGQFAGEVFTFIQEAIGKAVAAIAAKIAEHKDILQKVGRIAEQVGEIITLAFEAAKPVITFVAESALPAIIDVALDVIGAFAGFISKVLELKDVIGLAAAAFVTFKAAMAIQSVVQGFQQAKLALSLFTAQAGAANLAQAALNGTLTIGETIVGLLTGQITLAQLATAAWGAVQGAINGLMAAFNAVLAANPIVLIIMAIAAVIAAVVLLYNKCEWFRNAVNTVIGAVVGFVKNAVTAIAEFFSNLWSGIKNLWNTVAGWFDENVIQPIVNFFAPIVERISGFFEGCWIIIQAIWKAVSEWFDTNVIQPVASVFNTVVDKVSGFFSSLWESIKGIWATVSGWFDTNVIQPVIGFFSPIVETISGFFSNLWSTICGVWEAAGNWFSEHVVEPIKSAFQTVGDFVKGVFNGIIGFVEGMINHVIDAINGFIGGFNGIVSKAASFVGVDWDGIAEVSHVSLPRLAEGGLVTGPTFLEAGEAGTEAIIPLSELWSQMQGFMADALAAPADWISDALAAVGGGDGEGGPEGDEDTPPVYITYSPVYNFEGEAPSREDLVEAEKISQAEFNRMAQQWLKDVQRSRF